MSTFYVLPPRACVRQCLEGLWDQLFPGLPWDPEAGAMLAEGMTAAASVRPDVFVVYPEELPEGEELGRGLVEAFGAEPGDRVIELRAGGTGGRWQARTWQVPALARRAA